MFCVECGGPARPEDRFCPRCGQPQPGDRGGALIDTKDERERRVPPDRLVEPPPSERGRFRAESGAGAPLSRFLYGDWAGAITTVLVPLAVTALAALLLLTVLIVSAHGSDSSGNDWGTPGLWAALTLAILSMALGGSIRVTSSEDFLRSDDLWGSFSFSWMPLTLSVLMFLLLGLLFVHRARRSESASANDVALLASRTLVIAAVASVMVADLARHSAPVAAEDESASGTIRTLTFSVPWFPTVAWSLLWCALAIALAAACSLPQVLPGALRRLRDFAAVPVFGSFALLATAAGTWFSLAMIFATLRASRGYDMAGWVAAHATFTPNFAWMLLLVGMGVPMRVSGSLGSDAGSYSALSVSRLVQDHSGWVLLPIVVAALLLGFSVLAALHSPNLAIARRNCLMFGLLLSVSLFFLAFFIGPRFSAEAPGGGTTGAIHPDYTLALFLPMAWGLLAGLLGPVIASHLPGARLRPAAARPVPHRDDEV